MAIPASCISGRSAINRQHSRYLAYRFAGLVTGVVRDTVMAQVEIQAGPHRFVSLLSRQGPLTLPAGTADLDAFTETRWVTMRADIAPYPF